MPRTFPIGAMILMFLFSSCGGGGGGGGDTSPGNGGPPIATISAAAAITQDGATLNGSVTPNGLATQAWFEYGTDASLSTFTATAMQPIGDALRPAPVVQLVRGCTGGTIYYVRVCGTNAKGTTKSTVASFTTSSPGAAPTVDTLATSSVAATSAALNGNVTPNGLPTTAWFEWGTSPTLASYASTPAQSLGSGTTSQHFIAPLSGLSTGATYYCRVAASNSSGTSKGTIVSFTPGGPPAVSTLAASSVAATSATLNGNVTPNGLATTAWFEWGADAALATYSTTLPQSVGSGTTSVPVNAALPGLSTGTTYYYRVAANNATDTSRGTVVSFTVSPSQPDPGVADIRDEFLAAVNQARSVSQVCGSTPYGPAPPVSWSDNLAMAAYLHSEDMALNNFFSHTGSDGSSAGQRISRQGYPWRTYGENIAVGYPTVSSVIQGWLGSEGHCVNLMDPDFTEIGAGYAIGPYGGNPAARYWTFDLADR